MITEMQSMPAQNIKDFIINFCAEHSGQKMPTVKNQTPFAGIILCRLYGYYLSLMIMKHPGKIQTIRKELNVKLRSGRRFYDYNYQPCNFNAGMGKPKLRKQQNPDRLFLTGYCFLHVAVLPFRILLYRASHK